MIFRAKTYSVDMSALNPQVWQSIELGQAVTLAAKPGHEPNTGSARASTRRCRLYGYVQSVGPNTMSFKADDGRILTVDTSQVDAQGRSAVRRGDLVSVVGKTTARADQFVAEVIEREPRR